MRVNQPVTTVEHLVQEGGFLVSMTDLQSNITYVNDEFMRISGFRREELLGQDKPRRAAAPGGKVRHVFEQVQKLPRRQQDRIVEVVEALVAKAG